MKTGYVYKITIKNEYVYIGSTFDLNKRKSYHFASLGNDIKFEIVKQTGCTKIGLLALGGCA